MLQIDIQIIGDRLENKCVAEGNTEEIVLELHTAVFDTLWELSNHNVEKFTQLVEKFSSTINSARYVLLYLQHVKGVTL